MPIARPTMLASASGELKTRVLPKVRCRPCVTLKTPPLPDTHSSAASRLQSATSSPKTTMRGIARHFVLQRAIDRRDHRVGLAFARRLALESARRRIDVGRVDVELDGVASGFSACDRAFGRVVHLALDLLVQRLELGLAGESFGLQELGQPHDRIARGFLGPLVRRLVEPLVVRERVRIGTGDLRVHERRALAARARRRPRAAARRSWSRKSVPSMLWTKSPGNDATSLRDVAARRLHFDRHRDRVAVVFDEEDHRQLSEAGGVQRLPELAFAGRAVAERQVGDFVVVEVRARGPRSRGCARRGSRLRRSRSPGGTACRSGSTATRC